MADKKFLGLGFSFAANDKGLEKKLKSIRAQVRGINDGLSTLSRRSTKASSSLTKVRGPFISRGMQSSRRPMATHRSGSTAASHRTPTTPHQPASQNVRLSDLLGNGGIESKLTSDHQKAFGKVQKVLGKSGTKSMLAHIEDMVVTLDKDGKISEKSMHRMVENAAFFAKYSMSASKSLRTLKAAFLGVKDWVSDIAHNVKHTLATLGVDFEKIIPPQVQAAFGLVKSVLGGPINLMQRGLGFKGRGKHDTLKGLLQDMMNKKNDKKGIFGNLLGILGKLASMVGTILAGAIGLLTGAVLGFVSMFGEGETAKVFKKIGDFLLKPVEFLGEKLGEAGKFLSEKFMDLVEFISKPFKGLSDRMGKVGEYFEEKFGQLGEFTESVTEGVGSLWEKTVGKVSGFITDAVEGAARIFEDISKIPIVGRLFELGGALGKLAGFIADFLIVGEAVWDVIKAFRQSTSASDFFKKAMENLAKSFNDLFFGLPNLISNAIGKIFDWVTGKIAASRFGSLLGLTKDSAPDFVSPSKKYLFDPTAEKTAPIGDAASDPTQSLADQITAGNKDHSDLLTKQNDLLQQILDAMSGKNGSGNLNIRVTTDDRAFAAKVQSQEMKEMGSLGMHN